MQLKLCKLLIIFLVVFSFITFGHTADYNHVQEKVLVLKDGSEAEKIQVVQEL